MILFPYFELAASLFILLLAFHLHMRHHENRVARFYVRFALLSFFACILTYSLRIAFTFDLAAFINRISATLIAFSFAAYAHFALIFTHKRSFLSSKLALPLLYGPAVVVSILFLFTNAMYSRYEIMSYGIVSQPAPLYSIFIVQTALYTLLGVFLFFSYAKIAPQKIVRKQSFFIGVGSLLPVIIGLLSDELLPLVFQVRVIPPTVVFDFALLNLFIYIAMQRYSLFSISPSLAADAIMETMPDSMLVTDLDGRILFLNVEAQKFFHVPKEEIVGKKIKDLFEEKEKYEMLHNEIVKKRLDISRFKTSLRNPLGEIIPTLINASVFSDDLGSPLGIVFVVRDIRG